MNELICNFAIARFLPYRETGEFVNLGVVLTCPQTGYFDFLFEKRKHKRVTDFFPELDVEVLKTGLRAFSLDLERLKFHDASHTPAQLVLKDEINAVQHNFRELVRPREAIFCFGDIGTTAANDPALKLKELFDFYVKRQFAQDREYQEIIMRNQISQLLQQQRLSHYYKPRTVGNDDYHVNLPFVYESNGRFLKAIKPLHLAQKETTEIYRHGDAWVSSARRLRDANRLPKQMLFAVKAPRGDTRRVMAAQAICDALRELDVLITPFSEGVRILEFARV